MPLARCAGAWLYRNPSMGFDEIYSARGIQSRAFLTVLGFGGKGRIGELARRSARIGAS